MRTQKRIPAGRECFVFGFLNQFPQGCGRYFLVYALLFEEIIKRAAPMRIGFHTSAGGGSFKARSRSTKRPCLKSSMARMKDSGTGWFSISSNIVNPPLTCAKDHFLELFLSFGLFLLVSPESLFKSDRCIL